jgi:hypothetical protein
MRRDWADARVRRLLPLKQRLTTPDRLIGQGIYRLYGLPDDEIAMVEGR